MHLLDQSRPLDVICSDASIINVYISIHKFIIQLIAARSNREASAIIPFCIHNLVLQPALCAPITISIPEHTAPQQMAAAIAELPVELVEVSESGKVATGEAAGGACPATKAAAAASAAAAAAAEAARGGADWWARALRRHLAAVRAAVERLRAWLWQLIDFVLDEFEPWFKWVVLDAALALAVGALVRRVEALRPLFEAVGWA